MRKLLTTFTIVLCLCLISTVVWIQEAAAQSLPDEIKLTAKVSEILDYLALDDAGDYDKIFGAYDYICQSVEYDWASTNNFPWDGESLGCGQTAYEALYEEKAVCAGIAKAITLLLDELNVSCRTVIGYSDGIGHAWNIVELNGQWYFIDATADLGKTEYEYFLKCWDDFDGYAISSENGLNIADYKMASTSYEGSSVAQMETWNGFTFNRGLSSITIYSYTGTDADLVVPAEINGRPVKRLAQSFLYDNDNIKTLTLSEGIERINPLFAYGCDYMHSVSIPSTAQLISQDGMFVTGLNGFVDYCSAMETITVHEDNPYLCVIDNVLYNKEMTTILYYPVQSRTTVLRVPEGITVINDETFAYNNYLQEVILPDSITRIGYWAFQNCSSLKKVNIPENCTFIGQYAFMGTQLTEIHISAALEGIMPSVFPKTLEKITVDDANPEYYAADNVLFTHGGALICYAAMKPDEEYTIPEGITFIQDHAFGGSGNLKKVTIPEGVTYIGNSAFYDCAALQEITLPNTLTNIQSSTFFDCRRLAKLVIPASVQTIGTSVLANVYGTVIFGAAGSAAQQWAASEGFAFHDINSEWDVSGTLNDNITWTLSEDGLLMLDGEGKMGKCYSTSWKAYGNMIKSIVVSEGITSIGEEAFKDCRNLSILTLPDGITSIDIGAFSHCPELISVTIPDGVTTIDTYAFAGCSKLAQVIIPASVTYIYQEAFDSDYFDILVIYCVPGSYAEQYAVNHGISYKLHSINTFTIPESVKVIESQAFVGIAAEKVYIHANVTQIADDAFDQGILIITPSGSYAQEWARIHGFFCETE